MKEKMQCGVALIMFIVVRACDSRLEGESVHDSFEKSIAIAAPPRNNNNVSGRVDEDEVAASTTGHERCPWKHRVRCLWKPPHETILFIESAWLGRARKPPIWYELFVAPFASASEKQPKSCVISCAYV